MSDTKKQKLSQLLIGTHSGTFHADEALAVYLLRTLPRYSQARLVRTRDPRVLQTCDIVVDVGGEYDANRHRYDHHQRGFTETYSSTHRTKLSSAGLIYKHFGEEIVSERLGVDRSDPKVPILVQKLYDDFIEAIDGVDNGVTQYEAVDEKGNPITDPNVVVVARYRSGTSLASRVGHLNPCWNEPYSSEILDERFIKASSLTGSEFMSRLDYYAHAWLPARSLVQAAMTERFSNGVQDAKGQVLVFDSFCPWKDHLHSLEQQEQQQQQQPSSSSSSSHHDSILYVLYPDESSHQWRIQAVPIKPDSFESRQPLPEPWHGLRDQALGQVTGVDDAVFVHATGFTGGAKSKAGVLQLAQKALVAAAAAAAAAQA